MNLANMPQPAEHFRRPATVAVWRRGLPAAAVLLGFTLSYASAFLLRFDFRLPAEWAPVFWQTLPWVVGVKFALAVALRSVHGWVRYVSFYDLVALSATVFAGTVGVAFLNAILPATLRIPRSVIVLDFGISIMAVGGLRALGRFSQEQFWPLLNMHLLRRDDYRRTLLVGANRTGAVLLNQIQFHPTLNYRVVGFLDDDVALHGSRLGGAPVLGPLADAAPLARRYGAAEIFVLAGSLSGGQMRQLLEACRAAGIALKVIANVYDLVPGRAARRPGGIRLRDIDINDLLRREPIVLDSAAVGACLRNRVVMITGAGGSIGAEICRQVLRFRPRTLLLVERTENSLFFIHRELQPQAETCQIVPCLADITDQTRMVQLFCDYRPEVVFHAAAHKHVPMMEENPGEALKNNVFGTRLVADLAHEHGAQRFVFISTDKAVNPASVMGLSKQLGERYVRSLAAASRTRFAAVRFGNVLGSAGSVVPIFQEQIRNGGPITITHPEMRRYFMTIPEACQLVLQAGAMAAGGEVFVLDMGQPVRIVDLARDLIRLSGLGLDEIGITFTGTRPGEKLSEELYRADESTRPTLHTKVRAAVEPADSPAEIARWFDQLAEMTQLSDGGAIHRRLQTLFPHYRRGALGGGAVVETLGTDLRSAANKPLAVQS